METESTPPTTPIACDMTDAPDTATERIAEYQRLFSGGFIGRERIDSGIRFRFRLAEGLEKWVCDLASREKACCAFFTFSVTRHGDELWWEASVIDDDIARRILDEFYRLPDTLTQGVQAVHDRSSSGASPRSGTTCSPRCRTTSGGPTLTTSSRGCETRGSVAAQG
jgi:hypothetical protein